jgi:hypothetical protein
MNDLILYVQGKKLGVLRKKTVLVECQMDMEA